MKLKSRCKHFADGGAVEGLDVHPDLKVDIESDDASSQFQRQIDALRRAEQHQQAPQPQLTEKQAAFIEAHPEMVAEPERLKRAIISAHMANHEIDSEAFHKHVADAFRIQHLETAAHNTASLHHPPGSPEHQREASDTLDKLIDDVNDTPKFFKPKPESRPVGMQNMATSLAKRDPVIGDSASQRYFHDSSQSTNPTKITLSAEEKSIAKALGQSEVSYAQGKIELERRRREGFYDR